MTFDPYAVRSEFPILHRLVNGRPLVYLDNAASAQKPEAVIEAMAGAMRGSYANVHRGLHTLANEATVAYEAARTSAARLVNASHPENIVLTKGATHAINIVASGLGQSFEAGDEIVLSPIEHHSNIVPWHFLRERRGAVLRFVDVDDDGRIDLEMLDRLIGPRTRIVALNHMSNVLGVVQDAAEIVRIAHGKGVPVLLDGCQAVVHGAVDVTALDVDFYAFSAHKLYGPTGIGALYGKTDRLAALPPFEGGGEMIDSVSLEGVTYNEPPFRFEAGTPPILEAIGFDAAIRWLEAQDRCAVEAHEQSLLARATARLREMNGVRIFGQAPGKGAIVAFAVDGAHPHDVAQVLDKYGVAIRAGHHCAQPLMRRLGVSATARASFALYNTLEEVDAFADALGRAQRILG